MEIIESESESENETLADLRYSLIKPKFYLSSN